MKTSLPLVIVTLATALSTGSVASADHDVLRHYDDLLFAAYSDARELRWQIRDAQQGSPEMKRLLIASEGVIGAMRQLQHVIFDEESPRTIERTLNLTFSRLSILKAQLISGGIPASGYRGNGPGWLLASPAPRPMIDQGQMLSRLANIERNLSHLQEELQCGVATPVLTVPETRPPVPSTPWLPAPYLPGRPQNR